MAFPLTEEQRNIVEDRGGELLVSAAAGSGKTRVLVERLLDRVTGEGLDIDRFLVITYTRAAAAELRERIALELNERLAQDTQNRHLRRQTTLIYQAQISTIHSFCTALLRENGYLLDLDPDFRLCDEMEREVLMRRTLESVIDGRYAELTADSPFAALSDTLGAGRDDARLVDIVLDIFGRVQSHADPVGWLREQREVWSLENVTDMGATRWGGLLLVDGWKQAGQYAALLESCLPDVDEDELLSQNYGDSLRLTIDHLKKLATAKTWDEAAACFPVPFPPAGRKRKRKTPLPEWEEKEREQCAARVRSLRQRSKAAMETLGEYISGSSEELLEELRLSSAPMQALIDLVLEFHDAFAAEKKRRSLVDFGDLEHFAVKLLRGPDGSPTDVARSWCERFDEILVDEYQDTNQVQNAIFDAISDGGKKLTQVGDVKQSIYRFRLADPTIFLRKYGSFTDGEKAAPGQPRLRLMSKNFRSRPEVLEGCNDLFRAIMSPRLGELEYTDDQALVPGASFPENDDCAPELNILDLSDVPEDEDSSNAPGRDLLEARFTARRIRELLDAPFMVAEGSGQRPVRPSDIMVLMRSPGNPLRHYIRAFGELNIPWSAENRGDFFDTPEVHTALSILHLVDNPRQDVPLIAALRSPVYGFTADRLAILRKGSGGDYYDALTAGAADGGEDCRQFLTHLNALRAAAPDMTCSQLIWHIYEKTNILGIFGAMEEGEQRQENLLSLYSLAREMERSGCRTLFQFLLRLDRLQQSGSKLKTSGTAREGEGVSVMSIHRSKGLEKPVVLVCGLTKQMNKVDLTRPVLFHPEYGIGPKGLDVERRLEYSTVARRAVSCQLEREMLSEELRLLYVAMTRAREKLILILALKNAKKTITELDELVEEKPSPEILAQQKTVGHWVLLHALSREETRSVDEIAALSLNSPAVRFGPAWDVRWNGAWECFYAPARQSVREEKQEEVTSAELGESLRRLCWHYPKPEPANIPSKLTATQLKGRELDREAAEHTDADREEHRPIYRPSFITEQRGLTPAQRGTALHLVMEKLPLDGDLSEAGIRAEVARMVQQDFLTEQQAESIPVPQVAKFYASQLGQEVTRAKACHREFKFSLLVDAAEYFPGVEDEQLLLQGVVDLWFEDERGITVVDFKSDHVLPGGEAEYAKRYAPQLGAYSKALKTILGAEDLRTVLWFFKTGTAVELRKDE